MIFGKIVCLFKGHKRGKLKLHDPDPLALRGETKTYACPRCGHETRYKVKNGTRPATDS